MRIDTTKVRRQVEQRSAMKALVDVDIEVEHTDDETARELADELAEAVHGVLDED